MTEVPTLSIQWWERENYLTNQGVKLPHNERDIIQPGVRVPLKLLPLSKSCYVILYTLHSTSKHMSENIIQPGHQQNPLIILKLPTLYHPAGAPQKSANQSPAQHHCKASLVMTKIFIRAYYDALSIDSMLAYAIPSRFVAPHLTIQSSNSRSKTWQDNLRQLRMHNPSNIAPSDKDCFDSLY